MNEDKKAATDKTSSEDSSYERSEEQSTSPAEPSLQAENPLHRRLGLKPGLRGLVVAPPEDDDNPLLPLPEGYVTVSDCAAVVSLQGTFDYVHFFVRDRADLAANLAQLTDRLSPAGTLWISWMGPTSDRRNSLRPADLNDTIIRRMALLHGLVAAKSIALDRQWSATKLVRRRH
ncbi:MAG: DUF3052 domain-containing protein [Thermoleophilia bacterium]|nr:DUF3052 domain-containing protein [Thermoleophilia bacterium]